MSEVIGASCLPEKHNARDGHAYSSHEPYKALEYFIVNQVSPIGQSTLDRQARSTKSD